ncbi:flavin-containing monooxygenase [Streptomyces sp. NPDC056227]|uniref:flavin-containing monooxygenase n=1 Tax=Streptomyces sp. NPDC056227 TaxID=3345753 RepID=UPI0035E093A0
MKAERIAVVGAGAAGLCAAKHLLQRGHDVTIYERGTEVGGLWVYENDNGASPAYWSLRINSEAKVTGFRDFPIPSGASLFPRHTEMRTYFEAYAERFGLREHIRFRSTVEGVEPVPADDDRAPHWRLRLGDGSEVEYDRVVVANGHQAVPVHPSLAADFTGEYLHSRDYRTPERFAGRTVLVVGTGNSGLDIAADVCVTAKSTLLSARSPVLVMPRMLFGVPISRVLAKLEKPWLPWPVVLRIRELLTYVVHGRMEQWGFVTPKTRTHPASHPTVVAQIAWDRIAVRPGTVSADGTTVNFADGSSAEVDTVIAATGYEFDVAFLKGGLSPVVDGRIDLYRRIVHPRHPGLYFIGLFDVSGGANIRMMDIQSRWLGAVVDGEVPLPDEPAMATHIADEHRQMARLYPKGGRYALELDPREYGLAIREDLNRAKKAAATSGRG